MLRRQKGQESYHSCISDGVSCHDLSIFDSIDISLVWSELQKIPRRRDLEVLMSRTLSALKIEPCVFNGIISTFSFYKRSWFSKYLSKQFFQQQWKFQNSPKFLFVWWHVWIKLRHLTGRFSNRSFIHLKIKLKTNFSFNELKHLMDPSGFYFDKRTNYLPNLSSVEKTIGQRDFQAAGSNDHQPMMAIYQK